MHFSSISRTQIDQTKTKVKLENMAMILVSISVHIDSKQVVPWTILPVTDSGDSVEQLCKRVFTGEMEEIRGLEGNIQLA